MLHGCTQNPEDFAAGTGMNALAEAHGFSSPIRPRPVSQHLACWNWFRPGDQARDAGEPAIIAGLTRSLRENSASPRAGSSSPASPPAARWRRSWARPIPTLRRRGRPFGSCLRSASDVASAFAAMRGQGYAGGRPAGGGAAPRLIVFHGTADTTVHPSNAARIVARHGEGGAPIRSTTRGPAAGRRGYTRLAAEGRDGANRFECWMVEGAPHAWSGGHPVRNPTPIRAVPTPRRRWCASFSTAHPTPA